MMLNSVPYAANPSQAEGNINFVFQNLPSVLQQMQGRFDPAVLNRAMQMIQQPYFQQQIRQDVMMTYGGMSLSQAELMSYITNKLTNLCNSISQQMISQRYQTPFYSQYPSGSYYGSGVQAPSGFDGGYQPQYVAPQRPVYGQNPYADDESMGSIYGNSQQKAAAFNPYPSQQKKIQAISKPGSQVIKPPTGKPVELNISEENKIVSRPNWRVDTRDAKLLADPNYITIGKLWAIEAEGRDILATTIRDDKPVENVDEEMIAVAHNASQLFIDKAEFAHVIDFDELTILRVPFETGKRFFDEDLVSLKLEKPGSIEGVVKVLNTLQEQGVYGELMGNILLERFNEAAAVNFLRVETQGTKYVTYRLEPLKSIPDLIRLLTDSGDPKYANWKEDETNFLTALKLCLQASFNRIFRPGCYLNPDNLKDRVTLLCSHKSGLRFGPEFVTGCESLTLSEDKYTDELKKEIDHKLKSVFVLKIERKVLVHNLNLLDIAPTDYKAHVLRDTNALIMGEFINKFGNLELVDLNDPTQGKHPLVVGMDYVNRVLVRRIY